MYLIICTSFGHAVVELADYPSALLALQRYVEVDARCCLICQTEERQMRKSARTNTLSLLTAS